MLCRVALMAFLCAVYTITVQADEPTKRWAGAYIGAAIGKTDGDVDFALSQPPISTFAGHRLRPPAQLFRSATDQSRLIAAGAQQMSDDGAGITFAAGYNLQSSLLLVGLEIDASSLDVGGERSVGFCQTTLRRGVGRNPPTLVDVCPGWHVDSGLEVNWMASVRGRVGVPIGSFLPFITAGLAWADFDFRQSLGGPNDATSAGSKIIRGHVVGGGLEYALDERWVLSGEYLKTDFGPHHGKTVEPLTISTGPGLVLPFDSSNDLVLHSLRAGLKFRF
jgi:opacity protein-like surface antigen